MATEIVVDPRPTDYRPVAQMPALTPAEIASARHRFVEVNKDAAAFDQAAAKDGINIRATSPEKARDARELSLAPGSTQLSDYNFSLTRADIPADHFEGTVTELRTFARDLAFSPALGGAVVERVSELGPAFAAKSPDEKEAWVSERVNEIARIGVSETKLDELRKSAQAVLKERGGKFGAALASSPVLQNDLWLLRTLSAHAGSLKSFEAKHGKR
jgi:hypothetical protein